MSDLCLGVGVGGIDLFIVGVFFGITIKFTDDGLIYVDDVIGLFFVYVNMFCVKGL